MTVFGYSRVSTVDQNTDNQKIELEQSGFNIDYFFQETVSGSTVAKSRTEFSKLLEQIREDETLIVSKLDRLGRNAIDVISTIDLLTEKKVKVIVMNMGNIDLTSSAGRLLLTCLSAVAEMELSLIKERTKSGLQRAVANGVVLGRKSKTTSAEKQIILSMLRDGVSVRSLAKEYDVSRQTIMTIRAKEKVLIEKVELI